MANKENQRPVFAQPPLSGLSPTNKPALSRQRDHSACRRPDTPLKVRKTRENLKQHSVYADIPPPCVHVAGHGDDENSCISSSSSMLAVNTSPVPYNVGDRGGETYRHEADRQIMPPPPAPPSTGSKIQRQKSVSRRMLSRVKQGISSRSRITQSVRPSESEGSLVRRLSGRLQQGFEIERRAQSFEISRDSVESTRDDIQEVPASTVERSFTNSTVSTADVLGEDYPTAMTMPEHPHSLFNVTLGLPNSQSSPPHLRSSPSPQPTPRPPPQHPLPSHPEVASQLSITTPCVDLKVNVERSSLDVSTKQDVWIAIQAVVGVKTTEVGEGAAPDHECFVGRNPDYALQTSLVASGHEPQFDEKHVSGTITTLRLCFKSMEGCRVREVVGQKTHKDLKIGQNCSLFIKLHVPSIRVRDSAIDPDQDSLLTELESIVGTLEMEMLHVEARYRHSLLPSNNVVTVRHVCKMKRPKIESRWSIIGSYSKDDNSTHVVAQLARYLASQRPVSHAMNLLQQHLDEATLQKDEVRQIRDSVADELHQDQTMISEGAKPSFIITDIDLQPNITSVPVLEQYSTAPNSPSGTPCHTRARPLVPSAADRRKPSSISLVSTTTLAPPVISAPRTTIALTTGLPSTSEDSQGRDLSETKDTARQLWRHIRRTSLSAKQLVEMEAERVQHLEAGDETLKELRRRALANKRSVGAETLKEWKWDNSIGHSA